MLASPVLIFMCAVPIIQHLSLIITLRHVARLFIDLFFHLSCAIDLLSYNLFVTGARFPSALFLLFLSR
jgi:hypothetical protein